MFFCADWPDESIVQGPLARIIQELEGRGAKVIDRLAADLRHAFPDITDLLPRTLKYMPTFAIAWPDEPIVQQAAARLPTPQELEAELKKDGSGDIME